MENLKIIMKPFAKVKCLLSAKQQNSKHWLLLSPPLNTYSLHPAPALTLLCSATEHHTSGFLLGACVIQGWLLFIFNLGMCDSKPA